MALFSSTKKTRYAVVGVGWFAQAAVLPGFANADNAELVAVVSGDPKKHDKVAEHYGVPAYTYEQLDGLLASGKVDAVYIALPNALHKEYTLKAAAHKVHVLCEKPLAADAAEAREMVAACDAAGVKLMTAYRLHLEHANLAAIELVESGKLGTPRFIQATNTQGITENSTRLEGELAGGPLMDLGVYCINATRYLFRAEPYEVFAYESRPKADPKFADVPETVTAVMKFPDDRLAMFVCSFGQGKVSQFRVLGTKGSVELDPAFGFTGEKVMTTEYDSSSSPKEETFSDTDHVGAELHYFADCIQHDKAVEPDGREGLIDMQIIDAMKQSCQTGLPVKVGPFPSKPRPEKSMRYEFKQVKQPKLIHAAPPAGE